MAEFLEDTLPTPPAAKEIAVADYEVGGDQLRLTITKKMVVSGEDFDLYCHQVHQSVQYLEQRLKRLDADRTRLSRRLHVMRQEQLSDL